MKTRLDVGHVIILDRATDTELQRRGAKRIEVIGVAAAELQADGGRGAGLGQGAAKA